MDAMTKALGARRGKGIDLTIILGEPAKEAGKKQGDDLAPPAVEEQGELATDPHELAEMEALKAQKDEEAPVTKKVMEPAMMEHPEMEAEAMEQGKKPRGLGDYVRMALAKKGQK